jgi:hypothetical protein
MPASLGHQPSRTESSGCGRAELPNVLRSCAPSKSRSTVTGLFSYRESSTTNGVTVAHIHGDGRLERHPDAMQRLMLDEALARQEQRIAYVDKDWSLSEVQR